MPIDYRKYPPGWLTEIRPRILKRDGHCCKFCGLADRVRGWWALVYANGEVYNPSGGWVDYLDEFVRTYPEVRITSMLQIWIP